MQIIERIVSSVGRRIDESSPMVDARLADGSRVNAIIPPLAIDGPCLSIRRFRTDRLGSADLVDRQALTRPMLDFLVAAVASRLNIIVCGGTGAGKTTLLNVLSGFISEGERIITIEDAAELMLRQRHVVRLETRPPNIEGKGAVKQRDLVINALRMRPDRIIIGEVRGAEALDMLQAMNTGHDGSLTTIHANSPRDALYRLDTMVAMASLQLPERAVRQQIASAVDLIVQISRLSDGTRRVTAISELTGMENDVITMQDIFVFERTGVSSNGKVVGRFRATGIRPKCSDRLAASGRPLDRRHVRARAAGGLGVLMPTGPILLVFAVVFGVVVGAFWLFVQRPEQKSTAALHRRIKGEARGRRRGRRRRADRTAAEARSPPARRDRRHRRRRRAALPRRADRARQHGHAARAAARHGRRRSASPARSCSPGCRRCGWSRCRSASPPAGCRSPSSASAPSAACASSRSSSPRRSS